MVDIYSKMFSTIHLIPIEFFLEVDEGRVIEIQTTVVSK